MLHQRALLLLLLLHGQHLLPHALLRHLLLVLRGLLWLHAARVRRCGPAHTTHGYVRSLLRNIDMVMTFVFMSILSSIAVVVEMALSVIGNDESFKTKLRG